MILPQALLNTLRIAQKLRQADLAEIDSMPLIAAALS
jgi:hypothetical protein